MRFLLALLALLFMSVSVLAQESDKNGPCKDLKPFTPQVEACLDYQKKLKDAEQAEEAAKKAAKAAKAAEDLKKLSSSDKDQQINGMVGITKDINSNGNNNAASKAVTNKSLGLMEELGHYENELLNNADNAAKQSLSTTSDSNFTAGGHSLNEVKAGNRQSLEEEYQQLLNTPPVSTPQLHNVSKKESSLEQEFDVEVDKLLNSKATVSSVAQAEQRLRAEEERYLKQKAEDEAARLAAQKAAAVQAKILAERKERAEELADEQAAQQRQKRWLQFMGLLPPDPPPYFAAPLLSGSTSSSSSSDTQPSSSTYCDHSHDTKDSHACAAH